MERKLHKLIITRMIIGIILFAFFYGIKVYAGNSGIPIRDANGLFVHPGIKIDRQNVSLYVGDTVVLSATANKQVVWASSDSDIATVNEYGVVVGMKAGTANITARSVNGNFTDTCQVTVKDVKSRILKLNQETLVIDCYATYQLNATMLPKTFAGTLIMWSSLNDNIAQVDSTGKVFACGVGSTIIRAANEDGSDIAVCQVKVMTPITDVYFGYAEEMYAGNLFPVSFFYTYPRNVSSQHLSWTSSSPDIISVDSDGTVYLNGVGSATITATTQSGASNSVTINSELPEGGYVGDINSELLSLDLIQTGRGDYYLVGEMILVEWVDGVSTIPSDNPIIKLKATDGSEEIGLSVTSFGSNSCSFKGLINRLSPNKEYVLEITAGSLNNYSPNRCMNINLALSPKMPSIKNLGKIGNQKLSCYQADNGELRLCLRTSPYVGNIEYKVIKTELVEKVNGSSIRGEIEITEWENGVVTTPFETPIIQFVSSDGKENIPASVLPLGNNIYYFEYNLPDANPGKEFVFSITSGDKSNVSAYRTVTVTVETEGISTK